MLGMEAHTFDAENKKFYFSSLEKRKSHLRLEVLASAVSPPLSEMENLVFIIGFIRISHIQL